MARVEDAREAEDMVRHRYSSIIGPEPYNFEIHKRGYTWVVKYNILSVLDTEEHEVHINAKTGKMLTIK